MCGGNEPYWPPYIEDYGLSPRVRGKLGPKVNLRVVGGSIPACAGETRFVVRQYPTGEVYPRVCGGNMTAKSWERLAMGLSPRVRGKLNIIATLRRLSRSIPACAGETSPLWAARCPKPVYPRVCGGNA